MHFLTVCECVHIYFTFCLKQCTLVHVCDLVLHGFQLEGEKEKVEKELKAQKEKVCTLLVYL